MIKSGAIIGLLWLSVSFQISGDAWLIPDKFFYVRGDTARLNIQQGENFTGSNTLIENRYITKLEVLTGERRLDITSLYDAHAKSHIQIPLKTEGIYQVEMRTTHQRVSKTAAAFNQWLTDYGLDEVLYTRQTTNTNTVPAEILQSTYNRLLFQVGDKMEPIAKTDDFPISIIPDSNPYTWKKGDPIKFTILDNDKPAFGVRVKIWNRNKGLTTIQNIYTEQDGSIKARISNSGSWMVSVAKIAPSTEPGVQWETHSANLIFGVK